MPTTGNHCPGLEGMTSGQSKPAGNSRMLVGESRHMTFALRAMRIAAEVTTSIVMAAVHLAGLVMLTGVKSPPFNTITPRLQFPRLQFLRLQLPCRCKALHKPDMFGYADYGCLRWKAVRTISRRPRRQSWPGRDFPSGRKALSSKELG